MCRKDNEWMNEETFKKTDYFIQILTCSLFGLNLWQFLSFLLQ